VRAGNRQSALAAVPLGVLVPGGAPLARVLAPVMGRFTDQIGDLSDLATTIEAEDAFDLAECARPIGAPTLIVAGTRDRFYPRQLLEETQRLIPGSVLHRIPGRGHLTVMTASRVTQMMRAFLVQAGR